MLSLRTVWPCRSSSRAGATTSRMAYSMPRARSAPGRTVPLGFVRATAASRNGGLLGLGLLLDRLAAREHGATLVDDEFQLRETLGKERPEVLGVALVVERRVQPEDRVVEFRAVDEPFLGEDP